MIQDKLGNILTNIVDFDSQNMDDFPERKQLIKGILHEGDSLMIGGDEYIGKSFMLMALAQALVSGGTWMGSRVEQSNVLFVNTHLKDDESYRRYMAIRNSLNIKNKKNHCYFWPVRGDINANNFFTKSFGKAVDELDIYDNWNENGRKFTVIIDDIGGFGFRSASEFLDQYIQFFDGYEPSLVFATCHFKDETYAPDSVILLKRLIAISKGGNKNEEVTAEFMLRNLPPKRPMCGKFTYPIFNWRLAEIDDYGNIDFPAPEL